VQNTTTRTEHSDAVNTELCKKFTKLYDQRFENLQKLVKENTETYKDYPTGKAVDRKQDYTNFYISLLYDSETENLAKSMLLQQCYLDEQWYNHFELQDK